jgi:hypothetical protein
MMKMTKFEELLKYGELLNDLSKEGMFLQKETMELINEIRKELNLDK